MNEIKKIIKNANGMSLIELTVAAAVSVIISAAVMETNRSGIKGVNNVSTKLSLKMWQANILTPKLSHPPTCLLNLGTALTSTNLTVLNDEGGNAIAEVGKDLANTGGDWAVVSITRSAFTPDVAVTGNKGNCDLSIVVANNKVSYGAKEQTVQLPIRCTTDSAITQVQSCSASLGTSDSLLSLQLASSPVEEFVYRNGNLLIGPSTGVPEAPFQIDLADTVPWPAGSGSSLRSAMKINGVNHPLVINNRALWDDGTCLRFGEDNAGSLAANYAFCQGNLGIGEANPTAKLVIGANDPLPNNVAARIQHNGQAATTSVALSVRLDPVDSLPDFNIGAAISVGSTAAGTAHNGYHVGLQSHASMTNAGNTGRSWGVWGRAGNANDGYNYGVMGSLDGTQGGAGIYGSIDTWGYHQLLGERYAGYFQGKTKVVGQTELDGDVAVTGAVKVGVTASACDATTEGSMQYDSVSKTMQFCDGSSWQAMGGGGSLHSGMDRLITVKLEYDGANWSVLGTRIVLTKDSADLTKSVTLTTVTQTFPYYHEFELYFDGILLRNRNIISVTFITTAAMSAFSESHARVVLGASNTNVSLRKVQGFENPTTNNADFVAGNQIILTWGTPIL